MVSQAPVMQPLLCCQKKILIPRPTYLHLSAWQLQGISQVDLAFLFFGILPLQEVGSLGGPEPTQLLYMPSSS